MGWKTLVLPSNVIHVPVVGSNKKHPAVFPLALPSFFIKLLSRKDSLIIDPFSGSGTTGVAALPLGRHVLLIDNNPAYCQVARLPGCQRKNGEGISKTPLPDSFEVERIYPENEHLFQEDMNTRIYRCLPNVKQ